MNQQNIGWVNGFIGVLIFAGSLPATKLAVLSFSPIFLTGTRAVIAAVIAGLCLYLSQQFNFKNLTRQQFKSLIIVAVGVVIGFPLFTALALESITSSRAILFVGLLPLATAIFAMYRASERLNDKFWIFAILGAMSVIAYMTTQDTSQSFHLGDFYMLISILLCGLGYAEGGQLSKTFGGWQVICWALIIAFPVMLILMIYTLPDHFNNVQSSSIWGLLYVSIFSMLIGFFFWYKGLALGGVSKVGQIQLLQPIFGLILSALLLNEQISSMMILTMFMVLLCIFLAKKYA